MIVAVSKEILSGTFHIVFSVVRAQKPIGYQMSLLSVVLKVQGNCTVATVLCKVTGGGGGVMPYMCHRETCRRSGYTFWPPNPRQGVFFRA